MAQIGTFDCLACAVLATLVDRRAPTLGRMLPDVESLRRQRVQVCRAAAALTLELHRVAVHQPGASELAKVLLDALRAHLGPARAAQLLGGQEPEPVKRGERAHVPVVQPRQRPVLLSLPGLTGAGPD